MIRPSAFKILAIPLLTLVMLVHGTSARAENPLTLAVENATPSALLKTVVSKLQIGEDDFLEGHFGKIIAALEADNASAQKLHEQGLVFPYPLSGSQPNSADHSAVQKWNRGTWEAVSKSKKLNKPLEEWIYTHAKGLDKDGKDALASDWYTIALNSGNDFFHAFYANNNNAFLLLKAGKYQEAKHYFANAVARDYKLQDKNTKSRAHNSLGWIQMEDKEFTEAKVNFEKSIALNDYPMAKENLERLKKAAGANRP